jgi:hypothetical protein
MPLGLTNEEYNDPCCGCGCEDDFECEECFEKLILGRKKMKDSDSAFPDCMGNGGMTLCQYAAIKLKVPRSGDPDIDAMIRESRRADFMGQAMVGITAKVYKTKDYNGSFIFEDIADEACIMASAILAEWEKTGTKEKVSDDA